MRLEIRGEYPPNRDELHDQVRAAAGGRCLRCGHPDDAIYLRLRDAQDQGPPRAPCDDRCTHQPDGKQRVLTVHHLDGDKSNSQWWNLLALCQSCHLTIQARVIPPRPWLFEHSEWFKPYAAGFYASYYGRMEITRAEAEAELDRWMAMGQPWRYEDDDRIASPARLTGDHHG